MSKFSKGLVQQGDGADRVKQGGGAKYQLLLLGQARPGRRFSTSSIPGSKRRKAQLVNHFCFVRSKRDR